MFFSTLVLILNYILVGSYADKNERPCSTAEDCSLSEECVNGVCIYACEGRHCFYVPHSECFVINHKARCRCKSGYEGNEEAGCKLIKDQPKNIPPEDIEVTGWLGGYNWFTAFRDCEERGMMLPIIRNKGQENEFIKLLKVNITKYRPKDDLNAVSPMWLGGVVTKGYCDWLTGESCDKNVYSNWLNPDTPMQDGFLAYVPNPGAIWRWGAYKQRAKIGHVCVRKDSMWGLPQNTTA